jgi:hypothetical protein
MHRWGNRFRNPDDGYSTDEKSKYLDCTEAMDTPIGLMKAGLTGRMQLVVCTGTPMVLIFHFVISTTEG